MKGRPALSSVAGFTLLEAMLAVALTAAIVLALATVTAQWLPNWRRGFDDLQRADLLSLGLERIVADVASAEYVMSDSAATRPLFSGEKTSVTFVRSALGPDSRPHLEIVRLAETSDARGFAIVRTRAPFAPLPPGGRAQYPFGDAVVLVRSPFRLTFAYAGPDRSWSDSWGSQDLLPDAVRVTVRDASSQQVLAASTATRLQVSANGLATLAAPAPAAPAPTQALQPDPAAPGMLGPQAAPQPQ